MDNEHPEKIKGSIDKRLLLSPTWPVSDAVPLMMIAELTLGLPRLGELRDDSDVSAGLDDDNDDGLVSGGTGDDDADWSDDDDGTVGSSSFNFSVCFDETLFALLD